VAERVVWLLAFDGLQAIDLTGPHAVFGAANQVLQSRDRGQGRYRLEVVSKEAGQVTAECGLRIGVDRLPDPRQPHHTVLVSGGSGTRAASIDPDILSWLAAAGDSAERLACVCGGAFVAAAAGLLEGKRVTTHWARAEELARAYPSLEVEPDSIWCRDGNVWTSAGVTAGIDLALAIVEHDLGAEIAQLIARHFVVFLRRPGGQSQFAAPAWERRADTAPVRRAQDLVESDPSQDLSLAALARHVGMSPRHLSRRFQAEVGVSPTKYIERMRLVAARSHLESSAQGLDDVARRCGFGTTETMRRTFIRHLGVAPDDYRRRFTLKEP
jgi:transcriptional regulator GlxA family with amidase domain